MLMLSGVILLNITLLKIIERVTIRKCKEKEKEGERIFIFS